VLNGDTVGRTGPWSMNGCMSKAAASLKALTGPARLLLLLASAWVIVWGSVWGYCTYRGGSMDRWISSELDRSEKLIFELAEIEKTGARDAGKEYIISTMHDDAEREIARRDKVELWGDRAKWIGPIGLASILFFGLGGQWVYRGFRKSVGTRAPPTD
jgi:hypothetical protein